MIAAEGKASCGNGSDTVPHVPSVVPFEYCLVFFEYKNTNTVRLEDASRLHMDSACWLSI